jgi:hypothetical protein
MDHAAAALLSAMKSRRLTRCPRLKLRLYQTIEAEEQRCAAQHIQPLDVRFGSKADIPDSLSNVRFTPESGHCGTNSSPPDSQSLQLMRLIG